MAYKKKKLTQRQWLNIIIMVMAVMMLVFVMTGRIIEKKLEPNQPSPLFSQLTKLTIAQWSVSQQQEQWHQEPAVLSHQELLQMVQSWQSFIPNLWLQQAPESQGLNIQLNNPQELEQWQLLTHPYPILVNQKTGKAVVLSQQDLTQLLPPSLQTHIENHARTTGS
ncbi:hypothetical protein [Pleionea sp. CnH1-48]|uniref:hypothetical protein n=1 Tax=Pleionea sp. CnH1-48 TaxID=2954494 RepID=UPI00209746D3|nr:hypothetical protein [Pleionea sp. CnH1-48]MCO7224461.1 hypothetical protein [Pleionea sp. CnH1-48]